MIEEEILKCDHSRESKSGGSTFEYGDGILWCDQSNEAIQLYSPAEIFVMLFKLALIFEYKNKILRVCYRIVLYYRTVSHRGFTFDSKSSSMANQM